MLLSQVECLSDLLQALQGCRPRLMDVIHPHLWSPENRSLVSRSGQCITRIFKSDVANWCLFWHEQSLLSLFMGEDTYMSQATTHWLFVCAKHCVRCLNIDYLFWRTFVSQKGKHISELAWGPVPERWVRVGQFAPTPASSLPAPDGTPPSCSELGIQVRNGMLKEIPSFMVCVVTFLFYVFTFAYPNDVFFYLM